MTKPAFRPYSQYTKTALELLGHLVREARVERGITMADLAERAGISRPLLQRIERGDPGCSIGVVFEVASILGLQLFEQDSSGLVKELYVQRQKSSLLPKSVRSPEINDDF